ncbi:hypothetical protein NJ7G_1016 [Natrinema sp. J7-2]|nr:hypothetical protein NJ7G_1016 [Natrinema sp. J7-2]
MPPPIPVASGDYAIITGVRPGSRDGGWRSGPPASALPTETRVKP